MNPRQASSPHQDRIGYLETAIAVHDAQIEGIEEDLRELSSAIRGLRTAIIGFALTVAGSAAAVVLTQSGV